MNKGKILFVNNSLLGLANFRIDVMRYLLEKGYEVVAVAPLAEKGILTLADIRTEFVPLNRASTNPLHDLNYLLRMVKLFRREKPVYAFMYTIKPNIYGTLAAKICGVPSSMMMAGLGYTFINNRLSSRIARFLYRIALKYSEHLMLLNEDNVNVVKGLQMCKEEKLVFLEGGEGVNLEKYSYCDNRSNGVKFLFVGRLLKEKGINVFIEAAKIVKKQYPEVEFQIAGGLDTEFPDSLKQEDLDELVKSGVVTYLGLIDMMEKLKEPGLVVTIPSFYSEGLNRSLIEGCATGKPIITTDQPGCRETVIDSFNGYVVPVHQPSALADAMIKYLKLSSEEKLRMSNNSRRLAEDRFDVKHVITAYETILRII